MRNLYNVNSPRTCITCTRSEPGAEQVVPFLNDRSPGHRYARPACARTVRDFELCRRESLSNGNMNVLLEPSALRALPAASRTIIASRRLYFATSRHANLGNRVDRTMKDSLLYSSTLPHTAEAT